MRGITLYGFNQIRDEIRSALELDFDLRKSLIRHVDPDAPPQPVNGPEDPAIAELLPEHERDAFREELSLAVDACKPFDLDSFREGHLTPVYWGSALRTFGVQDLIDGLGEFAPPPRGQESATRRVEPREPKMKIGRAHV